MVRIHDVYYGNTKDLQEMSMTKLFFEGLAMFDALPPLAELRKNPLPLPINLETLILDFWNAAYESKDKLVNVIREIQRCLCLILQQLREDYDTELESILICANGDDLSIEDMYEIAIYNKYDWIDTTYIDSLRETERTFITVKDLLY